MGRTALEVSKVCFFWGMFQHRPILEAHLQRGVDYSDAVLEGHEVYASPDQDLPVLGRKEGGRLRGKICREMSLQELEAMDFAQGYMGYQRQTTMVETADGSRIAAEIYVPENGEMAADLPLWRFEDWVARFGDEYALVAPDFFPEFMRRPAVAARIPQLLVRAGSQLRAQAVAPTDQRHKAALGDVQVSAKREPYARFFAVEEIDVSYRRFDGSQSPEVTRAAFISCDAVTVLPYDPVRDRVLVVEQFRTGPHLRGDAQPWQLEAIAGRIDSGETPEAAARREAVEEAGLDLGDLIPVAQYYPSPGIMTEFLYSYVALTDLPDDAAGVFGVEGEAEDIRGHVISYDRLMELVSSGEIGNAPTLLSAYWLTTHRARLRGV